MIRNNLGQRMASSSIYPYLGPNGSTFINNAVEENRVAIGTAVILDAERAADEHLENGHHTKDPEFERVRFYLVFSYRTIFLWVEGFEHSVEHALYDIRIFPIYYCTFIVVALARNIQEAWYNGYGQSSYGSTENCPAERRFENTVEYSRKNACSTGCAQRGPFGLSQILTTSES